MMEGLRDALQYITSLKEKSMEPKIVEIEGNTYCTRELTRYHRFPMASSLSVNTLTALVDYIKGKPEELRETSILHVVSPTRVSLYSGLIDERKRESLMAVFYAKYARAEGITLSEAKRKVSKLDIEEYGRKAARYVKTKDFSKQANDEMRLYNATMKINRLELLKANIGLELVAGFDELQKYFEEKLTNRTMDEFKRQSGILGRTVQNNEKAAHAVVNASFKNATYSDRIWMYQGMLKAELDSLLKTGLIQGKHPTELARHLQKRFGVSAYNANRLMVTELARVQTEAQKQSFIRNGFTQYTFLTIGTACETCRALDEKHFDINKMMPGENAPPMHPNCRCSVAAYMDDESYEEWLDTYKEHGLSYKEWKASNNSMADTDRRGRALYNKGLSNAGIKERSQAAYSLTEKYTVRKSKWSGETIVNDEKCKNERIAGRKEWSCDILLSSACQDRTVIHEHLHARSGSYLNPFSIIRYKNMEEASVELLAREICKAEGIGFTPNRNHKVDYLYEMNHKLNICDSDLDFATALFAKSIKRRYNWLSEKVERNISTKNLSEKEKEKLKKMLKSLEGYR